MLYRENGATDLHLCDEKQYQNMALKRPTMLGPWSVLSLGALLVCFLAYLVYSNFVAMILLRPTPEGSSQRRTALATLTGLSHSEAVPLLQARSPGSAVTTVPHSRAANALLGGQGPALLPGSGAVGSREAIEAPISVAGIPR